MTTRVLLFWPASLGVAIVVAWTASTVPLRRTLLTKSCRVTVMTPEDPTVADCDRGARAWTRPMAPAAAIAATTTTATTYSGLDMREKDTFGVPFQTESPAYWLGARRIPQSAGPCSAFPGAFRTWD